jgi:UDP-glucuronate 4-epimerase
MKYLVTGCSGFIGGNLCRRLAAYGEVFAVYHHQPPLLLEGETNIRLVPLAQMETLIRHAPVDMVIHCAAVHPHSGLTPPAYQEYLRVNGELTGRVAEIANCLSATVFLYLSTISVYGAVTVGCLDEKTPFSAPGLYGASKYLGELVAQEVCTASACLCLRLPGVVGRSGLHAWLCGIKQKALHDQPITIYNPRDLFNNITDIDDIVRFIRYLPDHLVQPFDCLNMAAAAPLPVVDVVSVMLATIGSKSRITVVNGISNSFVISTGKLQEQYGFSPVKTEDAITRFSME